MLNGYRGTYPTKDIEKTKTSKADLVAALKDAVAYCNKAYAGMTDAQGSQMVKLMNYDVARLTVLSVNTAHTDEHYGNMVTYLRLKGIVPPSSEKTPARARCRGTESPDRGRVPHIPLVFLRASGIPLHFIAFRFNRWHLAVGTSLVTHFRRKTTSCAIFCCMACTVQR